MRLPDGGTDIWLTQNAEQYETEEGAMMWRADEKYIKCDVFITEAEIEANFEAWWNCENPIEAVRARVATLEQENAVISGCLLELSEIVYA